MEEPVRAVEGGCELLIWVVPGASRDQITGVHDGRIRVRVTAPPEGGRANDAVCHILSEAIGKPVTLLGGATSRAKVVFARGATPEGIRGNLGY
ncbi:MAG: DUF167 domain-containing protein [Acidimicrobiia bacterium]